MREETTAGAGTLVSSASYHYDATGRMIKVEINDDSNPDIDSTVSYEYNNDALRLTEAIDDGVNPSTTRTYLWVIPKTCG